MSRFWKSLHKLTGVKIKMSSAYHLQTDGASEQTNKTIKQCLHFHVDRNQKGWVRALPRVRFHIMNSVNASTGFFPFQLHIGRAPHTLPPLSGEDTGKTDGLSVAAFLSCLELDVLEVQDNLMEAKAQRHMQPIVILSSTPCLRSGTRLCYPQRIVVMSTLLMEMVV